MGDSKPPAADADERWTRLTDKQRACLDLLLERKTSKMIARELAISKDTVDQRITAARHILGATDRHNAALLYGQLKSLYDRIAYDTAPLPPALPRMPSEGPDGDPGRLVDLKEVSSPTGSSSDGSPFRDLLRHDYRPATRVLIMVGMFVATVILILGGLAIGQALSLLLAS